MESRKTTKYSKNQTKKLKTESLETHYKPLAIKHLEKEEEEEGEGKIEQVEDIQNIPIHETLQIHEMAEDTHEIVTLTQASHFNIVIPESITAHKNLTYESRNALTLQHENIYETEENTKSKTIEQLQKKQSMTNIQDLKQVPEVFEVDIAYAPPLNLLENRNDQKMAHATKIFSKQIAFIAQDAPFLLDNEEIMSTPKIPLRSIATETLETEGNVLHIKEKEVMEHLSYIQEEVKPDVASAIGTLIFHEGVYTSNQDIQSNEIKELSQDVMQKGNAQVSLVKHFHFEESLPLWTEVNLQSFKELPTAMVTATPAQTKNLLISETFIEIGNESGDNLQIPCMRSPLRAKESIVASQNILNENIEHPTTYETISTMDNAIPVSGMIRSTVGEVYETVANVFEVHLNENEKRLREQLQEIPQEVTQSFIEQNAITVSSQESGDSVTEQFSVNPEKELQLATIKPQLTWLKAPPIQTDTCTELGTTKLEDFGDESKAAISTISDAYRHVGLIMIQDTVEANSILKSSSPGSNVLPQRVSTPIQQNYVEETVIFPMEDLKESEDVQPKLRRSTITVLPQHSTQIIDTATLNWPNSLQNISMPEEQQVKTDIDVWPHLEIRNIDAFEAEPEKCNILVLEPRNVGVKLDETFHKLVLINETETQNSTKELYVADNGSRTCHTVMEELKQLDTESIQTFEKESIFSMPQKIDIQIPQITTVSNISLRVAEANTLEKEHQFGKLPQILLQAKNLQEITPLNLPLIDNVQNIETINEMNILEQHPSTARTTLGSSLLETILQETIPIESTTITGQKDINWQNAAKQANETKYYMALTEKQDVMETLTTFPETNVHNKHAKEILENVRSLSQSVTEMNLYEHVNKIIPSQEEVTLQCTETEQKQFFRHITEEQIVVESEGAFESSSRPVFIANETSEKALEVRQVSEIFPYEDVEKFETTISKKDIANLQSNESKQGINRRSECDINTATIIRDNLKEFVETNEVNVYEQTEKDLPILPKLMQPLQPILSDYDVNVVVVEEARRDSTFGILENRKKVNAIPIETTEDLNNVIVQDVTSLSKNANLDRKKYAKMHQAFVRTSEMNSGTYSRLKDILNKRTRSLSKHKNT